MPPNDGMPGGPMPPGFFPPFMSPRYPGGPRPSVRMPQMSNDFNPPPGGVPGQPMMPNNMDPTRQGDGADFVGWQGPPGMSPMNPRMNHPRGPGMGPMTPGGYVSMRGPPPNSSMGQGMPPMGMGPGGRPWQPNSSMNYSSSSPGAYAGPPGSTGGPPGPGTPIMPSPQGSTGPFSPAGHRLNTGPGNRRDSSNSGGDGMYTIIKSVPGGNMPGDFPMGGGPDGPMGTMGPNMPPVMNGDGLDGMKNSPANGGPGTPREDGPPIGDYGLGYPQDNVNVSYRCHSRCDCAYHPQDMR